METTIIKLRQCRHRILYLIGQRSDYYDLHYTDISDTFQAKRHLIETARLQDAVSYIEDAIILLNQFNN